MNPLDMRRVFLLSMENIVHLLRILKVREVGCLYPSIHPAGNVQGWHQELVKLKATGFESLMLGIVLEVRLLLKGEDSLLDL